MKWILVLIAAISMNGKCENGISNAISELNKEKAEFISEKIIDARWGSEDENENKPKEQKPKKKLKECIKPNNVIDDEVKRCMDGK